VKIAILGTSNGVLKDGYARFLLTEQHRHEVRNFSLGGNCSIYASYGIEKYGIAESFDYCVLDFCINDENFCDLNTLTVEQDMAYLYAALCRFNSAKCIPVILLLTNERYAFHLEKSPAYRHHLQLARMLHIKTIDFARFINTSYDESRIRDIYRDAAHYTVEFQRMIANCVSYELGQLPARGAPAAFDFMTLTRADAGQATYVDCTADVRKTALIETPVRRMTAGSRIGIDATPLWFCGIVYWADAYTVGLKIVHASATLMKNLRLTYHGLFVRNMFHPLVADGVELHFDNGECSNILSDPTQCAAHYPRGLPDARIDVADLVLSDLNPTTFGMFLFTFFEIVLANAGLVTVDQAVFSGHGHRKAELADMLRALSRLETPPDKKNRHAAGFGRAAATLLAKLAYLVLVHDRMSPPGGTAFLVVDEYFKAARVVVDKVAADGRTAQTALPGVAELDGHVTREIRAVLLRRDNPPGSLDYLQGVQDVLVREMLGLVGQGVPGRPAAPGAFDEKAYLKNNPDVAAAVKSGRMPSGFVHWLVHGIAEKRRRG
jgi:hypothetical protein